MVRIWYGYDIDTDTDMDTDMVRIYWYMDMVIG